MTGLVARLPRPVAFVLGGGASLGAVQVGMLQALDEAQIRPDLIVGTSVGALNGALLAERPAQAVAALLEVWSQLERRDVFPGNLLSVVWRLSQSADSLVGLEGVEQVATRVLHSESFADLEVPLAVMTLDLGTGEQRVLDSGPLLPALLAGAAIPGVFPPVVVDGHRLVDGGTVVNVPVTEALRRGAASMVVLDCTVPVPDGSFRSLTDVLVRVTAAQQRLQLETSLPAVTERVPVLVLDAPPPRPVSPFEFDMTAALIGDAYRVAREQLAEVTILGPGLYGDPFSRYAVPR